MTNLETNMDVNRAVFWAVDMAVYGAGADAVFADAVGRAVNLAVFDAVYLAVDVIWAVDEEIP